MPFFPQSVNAFKSVSQIHIPHKVYKRVYNKLSTMLINDKEHYYLQCI